MAARRRHRRGWMKPGSFSCGGPSLQPGRYPCPVRYFGKDTSVKKLRAAENHSELKKRYNTRIMPFQSASWKRARKRVGWP